MIDGNGSAEDGMSLVPNPDELRLLKQASEAAEKLHAQFANLKIREQELEGRSRQLDEAAAEQDAKERQLKRQAEALSERSELLVSRRGDLERLEAEVTQQREALTAEAMREVDVAKAGVLALQQTFNDERDQFRAETAIKREKWEKELKERRELLDQNRARLAVQIRDEVSREFADFERERDAWLVERDETNKRLNEQSEELRRQRDQFEEHLANERQRVHNELEIERDKFEREQAVLGNRYTFQIDHLTRSREELNEELRIFRREQQRFVMEAGEFRDLHKSRLEQFDRYRSLLDQREASLQRQIHLLREASGTQAAQAKAIKQRIDDERAAWVAEKRTQKSELDRLRQSLAAHVENLEERHRRLDSLRDELEGTHAATLEARIAVEQVFAQASQALGIDAAESRVAAARTAISNHYARLRESLASERRDVIGEREKLDQQLLEMQSARDEVMQFLAERDEAHRLREEELAQVEAGRDDRESHWREAQQRWQKERMEAEGIIRDLLRHISEMHRPAEGLSEQTDVPPAAESAEPGDQTLADAA